MIWQFVLLTIVAYLLGSVPTAYLVARWRRGIDIRRFGSGNVGITNVIASGSRWSSLIVLAFDLLKGMAPVLVARTLDLQVYQQVVIGLAAIAGHNWTVFLRFNGGRGVLTTLGVILALTPWLGVALLALACLFLPFRQFALGTLVALVLNPLCSWFLAGLFRIDQSLPLTLGFGAIALVGIIRRLTVPRTEFWATVPIRQILLNRLLFDRDIRDRKEWLSRAPRASH